MENKEYMDKIKKLEAQRLEMWRLRNYLTDFMTENVGCPAERGIITAIGTLVTEINIIEDKIETLEEKKYA